jgi:uncharacterized protein YbaA (DUF1428 family)
MYVDGFVIAVPSANKTAYKQMAEFIGPIFLECGAMRLIECWGDDVPHGKQTDFYRAVEATADETVVFAWVEWPDKAVRDAGMAKMQQMFETDERFDPKKNPPPFDGKRMIFGGFTPIVTLAK